MEKIGGNRRIFSEGIGENFRSKLEEIFAGICSLLEEIFWIKLEEIEGVWKKFISAC